MAHRVSLPRAPDKPRWAVQEFKVGCHHCTWFPAASIGGAMRGTFNDVMHVRSRHSSRNPGHETYALMKK